MNQPAKQEIQIMEPSTNTLTPMAMLDRALASGAGIETIERLMALQERWEKNENKKAYDEAITLAKSEFPQIVKDKAVRFDANKPPSFMHETLSGIAKLIDPVLGKHGLSYRFRTSSDATSVTVTCIVSHRLGHSEENSLNGPHDKSGGKNSIQAVGSSVTYLQRYTLKGALGLAAADDDDGKAAGGGESLSAQQIEEMQALIVEVAADIQKFCKHMKVEKIEDIPAKRFKAAMDALNAKKAKVNE